MRSSTRLARTLRSALILTLPLAGLSACATPIVTTRPAAACADFIPPDWKVGVAGAAMPAGRTAGDWQAFADTQTGQLDKANERTKATIHIVERCEARDAEAVKRLTRRWWEFWK